MTQEAMKMALEALEAIGSQYICRATHHTKAQQHGGFETCPNELTHEAAITALREALAQPPVAKPHEQELVCVCGAIWKGQELICTPPPVATQHERTWVGLTDEEQQQVFKESTEMLDGWGLFYCNIEAKLKAKNEL